jgi:methanogenic corrinoid protein MtbC1
MSILIDTRFGIQCHTGEDSVDVRMVLRSAYDERRTTMNENARNSDRGTGDDHGGHDSAIVSMTSRGLSDLAASALARLNNSHFAGDLSEDAKACMKFPLASALATALCDDSSDIADLMVFDLIDAGLSVQDVCLDHLAPAARCLGEWWETDRLPFTEVTMATSASSRSFGRCRAA